MPKVTTPRDDTFCLVSTLCTAPFPACTDYFLLSLASTAAATFRDIIQDLPLLLPSSDRVFPCIPKSSLPPLFCFCPFHYRRCSALKLTLPAPPGTGRSHPLPIQSLPLQGPEGSCPLVAFVVDFGALWLWALSVPVFCLGRHLVPGGAVFVSAQASPRANLLLLHRCTTNLSSSITHRRPISVPDARRWRAPLTSCRCYLSAATVIQVAFLPEPHPPSSSLRPRLSASNNSLSIKHPARHIFHRPWDISLPQTITRTNVLLSSLLLKLAFWSP